MGLTQDGWKAIASLISGDGNWTAFDNAHAALGVGNDTSTAFAPTDHFLKGGTTLLKGMDTSYPTTSTSSNTITFEATFAAGEANFTWGENGVFNYLGISSDFTGAAPKCMLTRASETLLTKTNTEEVVLTKTLTWQS
jgi:hypothetical protein